VPKYEFANSIVKCGATKSVNEHNNPAEPLTGGGHNWVLDQGSTLCKETDVGPAGGVPTSWNIPPNTPSTCVVLPIIIGGVLRNLGDIPFQGDVITPTCNPAALSTATVPNPANTYFNQLGCSISHGVATTPATAGSYLFVAGIRGGGFNIPLLNVTTPVVGGDAGKVPVGIGYYSAIPQGQKLSNAVVSKDGQFALFTSIRRLNTVFGCLNPLGDPGLPSQPINPNFVVPSAGSVLCMGIGNNNLQVDLTDSFGPDNQPYFGGQRVVNTFNSNPGGNFPTAWPNCIWQTNGSVSLLDAFQHNRQGGCNNAFGNSGFLSALITQPQALVTHGQYMYSSSIGGVVTQFKVSVDPISGFSSYQFRNYVSGLPLVTGVGVADDLKSLMVYSDPSGIGSAGQEDVTKMPLCEDM